TPATDRVQNKLDQRKVALALARCALALNIYRQRSGHYPASLAEAEALLGESLPDDPLNDRRFTYRQEGNGYLLYSYGANGRDDGGENDMGRASAVEPITRMPPRPRPEKDDIAWRVGA